MESPYLIFVLVVLVLLSGLSNFFGKNLPKFVWWVSLTSAALSGLVLGSIIAPFPDSICIGSFASALVVSFVLVLRLTRRNQPR